MMNMLLIVVASGLSPAAWTPSSSIQSAAPQVPLAPFVGGGDKPAGLRAAADECLERLAKALTAMGRARGATAKPR